MRTTRKMLENMVAALNKKLNRPESHTEGHLYLDHNSDYGGYQFCEVSGKTGERHPIGAQRHTAGQMWSILKALTEVICFNELSKF